jgi:hypothetical protein
MSFILGDIRRPSFLAATADTALKAYGITSRNVFEGGTSKYILFLRVISYYELYIII